MQWKPKSYIQCGNVLHKKQDILHDSFDSQQEMADGFSRYFQQTIQTIRYQFDTPLVEQNESIPSYEQFQATCRNRCDETNQEVVLSVSWTQPQHG